ncbi:hypothetical protein DPMN_029002 [Dreissena polymorpha]|uniref:Uncharacterized protein n=1 Tax=Dreissena polymorpha TaxID=45954 RepID=A0A9D4LXY6_DREPO|nr:hypothetical protein DPMN_029002 [Dreissena polymorpha]
MDIGYAPSKPDTLGLQDSSGQFVPINPDNLPSSSGFNYQMVDLVDGYSSLSDTRNLVHDTRSSISNSVSADSLHTAGVVDNEADSEADSNDVTDQYLSSINWIYEMIFQNLCDDYCPRPGEMSTNSTISITEN